MNFTEMAEVTLIDFSYLNRLALLTFTEVGLQFSNQDSRLEPVIEKTTKLSTCNIQDQLLMTSVVLISKVQPCPTSSGHGYARIQPWQGHIYTSRNSPKRAATHSETSK